MEKQFCVKTLILCLCVFFVCNDFAGQKKPKCADSDNDGKRGIFCKCGITPALNIRIYSDIIINN